LKVRNVEVTSVTARAFSGKLHLPVAACTGIAGAHGNGRHAKTETQLTHFTSGVFWDFRYSPDGKFIAMARGSNKSDAVRFTDSSK
jgi:hypothetical protein